MAFKFIVFSALLAVASAGVLHHPVSYAHVVNPAVDAVAATHQNVVRSFGGTVSQYSKNIETPYSSVHKSDTRISNNVYTPAVAKTVTYAAPAVTKTFVSAPSQTVYEHHEAAPAVYEHAEPAPTAAVYTHAAPVAKTVTYAAPAIAKTVTYAAPAVAKTVSYAAPVHQLYHHEAPVTKTVSYAAPAQVYQHEAAPVATTTYNHGPAATTYTHNSPSVAAYGSSQTVHYSPAEMVSHMSFDGFGTHWGF
ncbi:cuticle protein-like [Bactrocera neohumeralis]|uniref:cuticle protein-like n=1 Tax=Bactrocera neohumeralis TaxID=98809 RepID=UPI002165C6B5|nr:cuticle protein-like [Bactrocera neohumeralis]